MPDREVQVPADQNLQEAQGATVLNQPSPPPPLNPQKPPVNPQNAAAVEVTLEVCLIFCFLSFLLREHVFFIAAFSSFSSCVVMPCFVT